MCLKLGLEHKVISKEFEENYEHLRNISLYVKYILPLPMARNCLIISTLIFR